VGKKGRIKKGYGNSNLLLFMALWVPISATLFRRAVLTLWYAFLFLGLRFFLFSSFCLVASTAFFCKQLDTIEIVTCRTEPCIKGL
jgi:hypothetical protein